MDYKTTVELLVEKDGTRKYAFIECKSRAEANRICYLINASAKDLIRIGKVPTCSNAHIVDF